MKNLLNNYPITRPKRLLGSSGIKQNWPYPVRSVKGEVSAADAEIHPPLAIGLGEAWNHKNLLTNLALAGVVYASTPWAEFQTSKHYVSKTNTATFVWPEKLLLGACGRGVDLVFEPAFCMERKSPPPARTGGGISISTIIQTMPTKTKTGPCAVVLLRLNADDLCALRSALKITLTTHLPYRAQVALAHTAAKVERRYGTLPQASKWTLEKGSGKKNYIRPMAWEGGQA